MHIRTRYGYDVNQLSHDTGLAIEDNEQNNRTKQEFAEEVDINTLLRRFHITGQLPENVRAPTYADFTEVHDFHSAANAIAEANEAFEQMPAEVRYRFHNDPEQFVTFCDDPNNRAEAEKLGLVFPVEPSAIANASSTAPPTPSIGENVAPSTPAQQATP